MQRQSPIDQLIQASKDWPNAWGQAETLRKQLQKDPKPPMVWPKWCYAPKIIWTHIVTQRPEFARADIQPNDAILMPKRGADGNIVLPVNADAVYAMHLLHTLGSWRYTQGIYRFDPALQEALLATKPSGEIPLEVILRLPEWAIYIETTGLLFFGKPLLGFWVTLDYMGASDMGKTVTFLLDIQQSKPLPFVFLLSGMDAKDAVLKAMAGNIAYCADKDIFAAFAQRESYVVEIKKLLLSLFSLVLYICSSEPEITSSGGGTPHYPDYMKTKKGLKLFPPAKPRVWDIGQAIGSAMRAAVESGEKVHETGKSPRPHIRRGHWHHFWKGSKTEPEKRTLIYYWLPPMLIGLRDE